MENFDPNKTPKKQILSAQIDLSKFEKATDEEKKQQEQEKSEARSKLQNVFHDVTNQVESSMRQEISRMTQEIDTAIEADIQKQRNTLHYRAGNERNEVKHAASPPSQYACRS